VEESTKEESPPAAPSVLRTNLAAPPVPTVTVYEAIETLKALSFEYPPPPPPEAFPLEPLLPPEPPAPHASIFTVAMTPKN
jgi:hypothetical protein